MTKTHQLLDLMRSGKPMTYQKIMAETKWSLETTKKVLHFMMGAFYVTHVPAQYVITPTGLERQKVIQKTPRQNVDKRVAQRKAKRERAAIERKRIDCETTVQHAVRTQPNSVFGLGENLDESQLIELTTFESPHRVLFNPSTGEKKFIPYGQRRDDLAKGVA